MMLYFLIYIQNTMILKHKAFEYSKRLLYRYPVVLVVIFQNNTT